MPLRGGRRAGDSPEDTTCPWVSWIQEKGRDWCCRYRIPPNNCALGNFSWHSPHHQHIPTACCWPSLHCAFGLGCPTFVFLPIQKQCKCRNTRCFLPMPAQDFGAVGTVAVHHIPQVLEGRRRAVGGKPVQMLTSWSAKGCGQGIKEKESSTDKMEQPWCLESESQVRVPISQIASSLLSALFVAKR